MFSPKSLIQLTQYFQISRLTYGMNVYLDHNKIIDLVQKATQKFIRSALGLKFNASSARTRLALGLPKLEIRLWVQLMKNLIKYENHFGEKPNLYEKVVRTYFDWFDNPKFEDKAYLWNNFRRFKALAYIKSINSTGEEYNIEVGPRFKTMREKILFQYPHRGDHNMLKYMINFGFWDQRLFGKCKCGEVNSRTHVTNHCKIRAELTKKTLRKIGNTIGCSNLDNLERWIHQIYFDPMPRWSEKMMRELMEIVRDYTNTLIIGRETMEMMFCEGPQLTQ